MALVLVLTVGGSIGEAYPLPGHRVFQGHQVPPAPWPAFLLVVAATVALAWRRSRPQLVLAVSIIGVGVYTALGYVNGAAVLAPLVALYAFAAVSPTRQAVIAAAITLTSLGTVTALANPLDTFGGTFPVFPATVGVALFAGIATANRRGRISALQARAELAERTQEDETRRRVDAERLRIARELHDIVAHTMSTINVQAASVAYAHPDLPAPVRTALNTITDSSKRGLAELRAILSVLRQADEAESTHPVPGLVALESLVATVSAAGLSTSVELSGPQCVLPASVDLAAYRIIQESLTNALRHAAPASATVRLAFDAGHLDIDVSDTGNSATNTTADTGGHGLQGMTERATAVGGTLTAGPGRDGGFQVHARLPLDAS